MIHEHGENKIIPGKGTLKEFCEEYDKVNAGQYQFATASQLFPRQITLGNISAPDCDKTSKRMIFEWVIYYKVAPGAIKIPSTNNVLKQPNEIDIS